MCSAVTQRGERAKPRCRQRLLSGQYSKLLLVFCLVARGSSWFLHLVSSSACLVVCSLRHSKRKLDGLLYLGRQGLVIYWHCFGDLLIDCEHPGFRSYFESWRLLKKWQPTVFLVYFLCSVMLLNWKVRFCEEDLTSARNIAKSCHGFSTTSRNVWEFSHATFMETFTGDGQYVDEKPTVVLQSLHPLAGWIKTKTLHCPY